MERDFKCFSLESLLNHDVLKVLKLCLADTVLSIKCLESFSKIGYMSLIEKGLSLTLIIDNRTAHPHVENLEWVELIFLPPNTTSHTQPMDQGIIQALKVKYGSLAVRKRIFALEKKKPIPKFSILSLMYILKRAWDAISKSRSRHLPTASENRESWRMLKRR